RVRLTAGLSLQLGPVNGPMPPGRGRDTRPSPTATAASVAVRAPDRQGRGPLGRGSWWCRALLADSVRPARAARGETVCGDRAHHRLLPSRAAPAPPTRRASPGTARAACDTAPPAEHRTPHAVVHPVPSPGAGTSGSRARHDRGERRTP